METMAEHDMYLSISKESILESLIEDYGTELKRVAYLYVKDHSLAEDLIQEVFISCYHHLDYFRYESSYRTWLMKITVNKSKDALKKWSFRNLISKAEIDPILIEWNTPESDTVTGMEKKELIQEVLKLPIKLREVIILFYYKEFTIEEIGSILDLNESTVKTRLFRAREKLKKMLERSGSPWTNN